MVLRWAGPRGGGGFIGWRPRRPTGNPWVGGLVWGLLAISDLNNLFAYSKLNEHIIIDIHSLVLFNVIFLVMIFTLI